MIPISNARIYYGKKHNFLWTMQINNEYSCNDE